LTWYLQSRAYARLLGLSLLVIAMIALPIAGLRATPSPAGATLALAVVIALIVPIALGWALSRGDQQAERVSPRPVWLLDAATVLGFGLLPALALGALWLAGLAPAGGIAARASGAFLGAMLVIQPIAGWRRAALAPVVVFSVVVIAGRGDDIDHPAPWAWIAAMDSDPSAWLASGIVLAVGIAVLLVAHGNGPIGDDD
jgi:hypothetical protein